MCESSLQEEIEALIQRSVKGTLLALLANLFLVKSEIEAKCLQIACNKGLKVNIVVDESCHCVFITALPY